MVNNAAPFTSTQSLYVSANIAGCGMTWTSKQDIIYLNNLHYNFLKLHRAPAAASHLISIEHHHLAILVYYTWTQAPHWPPPRGARQWPYTNPRGARAYQKNPNCNAEWRSRILPPSQLGKSHRKTDYTINRLNSNEKSVNSLGVFRPGSGGENPRKCQKKPATSTCRPFAGLTGPTWSKHG